MSWNYRIIKKREPLIDGFSYSIREVYYDDNDKPALYDAEPEPFVGEDIEDLLWCYKEIGKAFGRPVLVIQEDETVKEETS